MPHSRSASAPTILMMAPFSASQQLLFRTARSYQQGARPPTLAERRGGAPLRVETTKECTCSDCNPWTHPPASWTPRPGALHSPSFPSPAPSSSSDSFVFTPLPKPDLTGLEDEDGG